MSSAPRRPPRPLARCGPAALALAVTALLAACGPPGDDGGSGGTASTGDDGATLNAELDGDPRVGPAQIVVTLQDANGDGIEGAEVEVTGDMTHAGMVPVVSAVPEEGDGIYRSEAFEFTMAGDWVLTVEAELPDGGSLRDTLSLTVPAP